MKKVLLMSLAVGLTLLLTACGKDNKITNRLVCTQNAAGVDVELTTNFQGNKIYDMDLKYTMDLSEYSDVQINAIKEQDFCTIVKNAMAGFKEAFTNCKQSLNNKELLITSKLDVTKVSDGTVKQEGSIEEAKEGLESQGYKCVIK